MRDQVRLEQHLFLLSLQYLTRLPVPARLASSDDLRVRATKYQPLVGVVVGGIGAAVLVVAGWVWSWPVAVLLSTAATLWVTGAFHEQGLARSAHALAEGSDRETVLRSLRAAMFGRVGTLVLGFVLALKLAVLMALPMGMAALGLVVAHVLGRMAAVHVVATTQYASVEGLRAMVPRATPDGYRVALSISLITLTALAMWAGLMAAVCAMLGAIVLGQFWRIRALSRLGGYTRDCLGGVQQLAELGVLLGMAIWV